MDDTAPSTLCDAFEAVVGALYLDGGLDVARKFVLTSVAGRSVVSSPAMP